MNLPKDIDTEEKFYEYLRNMSDIKLVMTAINEMHHTPEGHINHRLNSLMNEIEERTR